jgi:hypothetical protein
VNAKTRVTSDGSSMTPVVGSGELTSSGELVLEVSARIDASGLSYEGVVDSFAYAIEPATTMFDPFLLDGEATVESALPPSELARVPVPSVPGATLVVDVTGGSIATTFRGTCAETADGVGQYAGATTTSGVVELAGTIEIEIPIVGTETFGPFDVSVEIPELSGEIDLGQRDLKTAEAVDGASLCDGAGDGSATDTDATDPDSGPPPPPTSPTSDPQTTTTATATTMASEDTGSTTSDETGDACVDDGLEPNDSADEAEVQDRELPHSCDGFTAVMSGTLDGPDDEDWFVVPSLDTDMVGCTHGANVTIPDVRVCVFVACSLGDAPISSCLDGEAATSPEGLPGCCSTITAGTMQIECSPGASTSVDAYVRVDRGSVCDEYDALYAHDPA